MSQTARQRREALVSWARDQYEDLDFTAARAWLAEAPGRHAAGMLPVYVPREIVHAAGMLPVGVHGGGSMEIIRGDAYYQSYICHLPRSVVELGQTGRLDAFSAMLFPSTCDVIRNLSGMWQLMKPGTYVRYIDLPQVNHPERALAFWKGELTHLWRDLCAITGVPMDPERLTASIRLYDEVRGVIGELYTARQETPWRVPTEELYLLLRAGEVNPPEEWLARAREYLAVTAEDPGRPKDNARVVVVGAFCEQPPLGLIKTLERAGCYVVDDDFLLGNRLLRGVIGELSSDPLEALAQGMLTRARKSSILYEPDPCGKRNLVPSMVREARADGVIFAAPSFCDPALLDRPMLREGAEAAKLPCIAFEYAENTGQFQQFREQAGTFSDGIKLWTAPNEEGSRP